MHMYRGIIRIEQQRVSVYSMLDTRLPAQRYAMICRVKDVFCKHGALITLYWAMNDMKTL